MRTTSNARAKHISVQAVRLRLRNVGKRIQLLLRLLRARPLRQRLALVVLLLVPLVLVTRSMIRARIPIRHTEKHLPTQPEGGAEGGFALTDANIRTNMTARTGTDAARVLRVELPAPADGARIAYFIQIGQDSIDLVPRLLDAMHDAHNVYILHIDAKVADASRAHVAAHVKATPHLRPNVHMLRAEMVTYKGVSMVLNTLAAMSLAQRVDKHWHYFINLSGSDYPLLSARSQQRLLARPRTALGHLNFLSFFPRNQWRPYAFRVRFMYWDPAVSGIQHKNARLSVFRGIRENPLERRRHFTFAKAEAWMILSRPFVRFVTRSAYAKRLLLAHLHVRSAPEHYFADVLYNHPLWRRTLVPDAFRKVVWVHQHRRSGQHPYILDGGKHPFSFWVYLRSTRSLFARKFSIPDSPLLDRIDERLSGVAGTNTSSETRAGRLAFYANICTYFDQLTKKALRLQNVEWPADAYPPPRVFDMPVR